MISVSCYILTAKWTPCIMQTIQCVLCWLQNIVHILIYFDSNIRHLLKHYMNKFILKLMYPKNTQCGY